MSLFLLIISARPFNFGLMKMLRMDCRAYILTSYHVRTPQWLETSCIDTLMYGCQLGGQPFFVIIERIIRWFWVTKILTNGNR